MEWIRLTDIDDSYFKEAWTIYEQSFPIFEQRRLEEQVEAMKNDDFYFTAIVEEEKVMAMIGIWRNKKFQYIEHLAVHPLMRGRQFGTSILNQLAQEGKTIILEIDPPVDNISINRLHFYEKNGFKLNRYSHVHPPYRKGYQGHELKLLSCNDTITVEDFEQFNHYLQHVVMKYAQKH